MEKCRCDANGKTLYLSFDITAITLRVSTNSETFKIYPMPVWMVSGNMSIESSVKENLIARVTSVLARLQMFVPHVVSHIFLLFDAASAE